MNSFKVSIIIVNWNGITDTIECLFSLEKLAYDNFEVIVVDNGSTDNSVSEIRKKFSNVTTLETGKNLGFAGGNNVGIRYALKNQADYILLLNNDTVVDSKLINHLVTVSVGMSQESILGAKIYYFREPKKIWYAGGKWVRGKSGFIHEGQGLMDDGTIYNSVTETEYVCGCVLFVSASTFRKIGLLDDAYFLTFEETDLCYRARKFGVRCFVVPDAKVWHKVSISFGGENSSLFQYYTMRNKLLWAEKYLPLSLRLKLYRDVLRKLLVYFTPHFLKRSGKEQPSWHKQAEATNNASERTRQRILGNRAQILGIRDYVLRRFGECSAMVRARI